MLGLIGVLLSSNLTQVFHQDSILQVYGPPGIYNFITTNLALTHSTLRMSVEVFELVGGQHRVNSKRQAMLGNFPHFRHNNVLRKTIHCGEDGTWTIKPFDVVTRDSNPRENLKISAAEVHHVPGVQTFGFVVEEHEMNLKFDPERAQELDLKPGNKYTELLNGFPVMNDAGTSEVQPEDVLVDNPFRARKFALLGDTCGVPKPMAGLCENADVLVHEATLAEVDRWVSKLCVLSIYPAL